MAPSSSIAWRPQLSICILMPPEELVAPLLSRLGSDRYVVTQVKSAEALLTFLERNNHPDCLVLSAYRDLPSLTHILKTRGIFLPTVILEAELTQTIDQINIPSPSAVISTDADIQESPTAFLYHVAEVQLPVAQITHISDYIDQAITQFLNLTTTARLTNQDTMPDPTTELTNQSLLYRQQRRLAEKLRERLGYLGVYYKRNPQIFLRNLPPAERQKILEQLKLSYRQIVLNYFSKDPTLNNKIDEFVNLAFFADVPVTQIVEIHMELMDDFSKQLKLEGCSEEVLLDYRLTLIDTIAHLCEMYRRSIPKDS